MHSFGIVVCDLAMYCEYKGFHTFIFLCFSEFQLEFPIIGFLSSILPRRSFTTHRYQYMLCSEKLEYEIARILRTLIRMKYIWNYSSCFCYSIFNSCYDEFFRMNQRECISNNLFGIVINYRSKVEMYALIDNVSKITSPDNIRSDGTEILEIVSNF